MFGFPLSSVHGKSFQGAGRGVTTIRGRCQIGMPDTMTRACCWRWSTCWKGSPPRPCAFGRPRFEVCRLMQRIVRLGPEVANRVVSTKAIWRGASRRCQQLLIGLPRFRGATQVGRLERGSSPGTDERAIEVLAMGLPLHQSVEVAIDITMRSALMTTNRVQVAPL